MAARRHGEIRLPRLPRRAERRLRADAPVHTGVAAFSYADGYPPNAGAGAQLLVDGVRMRTFGRV